MTVEFMLDGQKFVALNGGPEFKFNESVSFVIPCESQAEVDDFWNALVDGGTPSYPPGRRTDSAFPGRSYRRP